jgi:peptide/nickel transport system permease protein
MLQILRDLIRHRGEFRLGVILTGAIVLFAALSFVSPYPPQDQFVVPPDLPPSRAYWFGTTSRGQDVFWQLTFAIRNTMLFGFAVAILSRLIAVAVGLWSGYKGGLVDRALMSLNDTFIVIPLFPLLVLFYFVMRDKMSWPLLALAMACLGWAYDARLIRALALSLKTREFTQQSVFSGMRTHEIVLQEHLPYVLPIVFYTTMNNMTWSIGLEVTLSVLGFTNIDTPTVGVMIYWANQHTALVAGVWWWIAFPVLFVVMLFIGLFLLAVSMNEYIDPRSRLARMGGSAPPTGSAT